jgi:hypothetical protein
MQLICIEANKTNKLAIAAKWRHNVRFCKHPKLEFCQRPERNALAVIDGSEYWRC